MDALTFVPESEKFIQATFIWKKAKEKIANYLSSLLYPAQGAMFHDLAHEGRGMDDFPQKIDLQLPKNKNDTYEMNATEFFTIIADTIHKYIFDKLSKMDLPEEIILFFTNLVDSPQSLGNLGDDRTYNLLEATKKKYRDIDKAKFKAILRNESLINKLAVIGFAVKNLNFMLMRKEFDNFVVDLKEIQEYDSGQWIRKIVDKD